MYGWMGAVFHHWFYWFCQGLENQVEILLFLSPLFLSQPKRSLFKLSGSSISLSNYLSGYYVQT